MVHYINKINLMLTIVTMNFYKLLLVHFYIRSQHDVPEFLLKAALNDVIEDCVTYVGVDLNVATVSLLRYIVDCDLCFGKL